CGRSTTRTRRGCCGCRAELRFGHSRGRPAGRRRGSRDCMMRRAMHGRSWLVVCALVLAPALVSAQGFPKAPPESVGVSADRLNRLTSTMQQYVAQQRAAGIVTLLVRQGQVVHL